jgi:hypothetical protein
LVRFRFFEFGGNWSIFAIFHIVLIVCLTDGLIWFRIFKVVSLVSAFTAVVVVVVFAAVQVVAVVYVDARQADARMSVFVLPGLRFPWNSAASTTSVTEGWRFRWKPVENSEIWDRLVGPESDRKSRTSRNRVLELRWSVARPIPRDWPTLAFRIEHEFSCAWNSLKWFQWKSRSSSILFISLFRIVIPYVWNSLKWFRWKSNSFFSFQTFLSLHTR